MDEADWFPTINLSVLGSQRKVEQPQGQGPDGSRIEEA